MKLSRTNVGHLSLDDYVDVVAKIYSVHDRHRSIWDVWCHTLHHAAGIVEQIRIGSDDSALSEEIADFSLWLFTAVLKVGGDFGQSGGTAEGPQDCFIRTQKSCSDLLWQKYPRICPSCFALEATNRVTPKRKPNPCSCHGLGEPKVRDARARRGLIESLRDYSNQIRDEKPSSIDEWQEMFGSIFQENLDALSPSEVGLRLMEELGEASDAMVRTYTYAPAEFVIGEPNWRQLSFECRLADVFSWLFTLVEKLSRMRLQSTNDPDNFGHDPVNHIYLSRIIWERYGSDELGSFHCSKCRDTKCHCKIIIIPGTHPAEELVQQFNQVQRTST